MSYYILFLFGEGGEDQCGQAADGIAHRVDVGGVVEVYAAESRTILVQKQIIDTTDYQCRTIDYITVSAEPERSVMRSATVNIPLLLGYRFRGGSVVCIRGSYVRNAGRSSSPDVADINTYAYLFSLDGTVELPWNMQLASDLTMMTNRGYAADVMNRTQWIWNAELSKSLLKGRLVFKVSANDILGQVSETTVNISANARIEHWTKSLPRYVMATVAFRFNHNPRRN